MLWCETEAKPFDELGALPISTYAKDVRSSVFAPDYEREHLERRVDALNTLYVAFTRAENVLCLSDAEDGVAGESGSRYPSRFLLEMDMGELDVARGFSDDLLLAARDFIAEADRNRNLMGDFDEDESLGAVKKAPTAEFAVGDRVVHKIFGIGTVSGVDKKNFCYEITFDKFATPRSIQFDYPLTRI